MEGHNATSQALTNAKGSYDMQVNLYWTPESRYKVGDKVLVCTKNLDIKNVSREMKPLWIVVFTILSANYGCNNSTLDLSIDSSLNLIYNTFHVSKVKPYVNKNSTLFPQHWLEKPGPVLQDRCEIKKVIEDRKAPRTGIPQEKVCWLGYSCTDDQSMDVKDISTEIL